MSSESERPNVVMFITHDQGDWLGCYGHETVESPNLDKLSDKGVRFTNYFAGAPECTPSRAGMYTGLYTHQTGLMGLCHRGWEFNSDTRHLAKMLFEGGYQTHLFGHQHETESDPRRLGYDNSHCQIQQRNSNSGAVCRELIDFIETTGGREQKQPFFASVGFTDVHRSWKSETTFNPDDIEVPGYLPDNGDVRRDIADFHQAILEMDSAVGSAIEAIDKSALADNTIVIFTTDHGVPFPRAKSTFYDPGIKIPLLIRWPDGFEGGRVCDELVSNLDYCPTILEACGVEVPEKLEGKSFLGLLRSGEYEDRDEVYGALYYDSVYDPMHYVRTKDYKYIRSFAVTDEDRRGADTEMLTTHETGNWIRANDNDVGRSLSWQSIKGEKFAAPDPEELYDLRSDSLEKCNVAGDANYAEVLEDMRGRMRKMMERTDSPMLKGHVSVELSSTRNVYIRK